MRVATKLGLAEFFESQAAECERLLRQAPYSSPQMRLRTEAQIHNSRAAAYAIRKLSLDQEIDMLEFQVGGPDGIGIESYDNPISILRPPPPEPPPSFWQRMLDTITARDPFVV